MEFELRFSDNPLLDLQRWFQEAVDSKKFLQPDAVSLATAALDGTPYVRTVLFKGILRNKISFFTNYQSAKGQQLQANPKASMLFYWSDLNRQIRIDGTVEKCLREESEVYFESRPRESQLGAWASLQSQALKSREDLEKRFMEFKQKFEGQKVPCPTHWGGFLLTPHRFEFWQAGLYRLHDRLEFKLQGDQWKKTLLNP